MIDTAADEKDTDSSGRVSKNFEDAPVFFLDSAPTPLDLWFRLFGFPVRVTPWFWVVMALIGSDTFNDRVLGPLAIVIWTACGFISILVHELGHSISAKWFRCPSQIVLIAFGGYAEYYDGPPPSGWRRLLVALAGPIAGLLLFGLVLVSDMSVEWASKHPVLSRFYIYLLIQNLVWSLFNLLPIFPMDGGKALREILYICGVRRPDAPTYTVSVIVAGLLVTAGLMKLLRQDLGILEWLPYTPGPFMLVWFGMMAYQNYELLQQSKRFKSWDEPDDDNTPWARRR